MADTQTEAKKPAAKPKGGAPKGDAAPKVKTPRVRSDYVARLKTQFEQVIRAEMTKQFGYKNKMQVPMITKVVLNMGIGEGVADRKKVDGAAADLSMIAGHHFDVRTLVATLTAFVCFCAAASSAYIINDLLDLPGDRDHPRKSTRPFAVTPGDSGCVFRSSSKRVLS